MNFLRQLKWELYRMFARRRTWVGFVIFVIVELLLLFMFTRDSFQSWFADAFSKLAAGGFEKYFSALTLGNLIVTLTTFFLATAFLSLVAGDIVAKESEDGNLRLLLARPVSRLRILILKYLACQIYALGLFAVIGATSLVVGMITRGWGGGMIVLNIGGAFDQLSNVSIFEWNEGMGRYWLMMFGIWMSFIPVTSIAFALSCLKIKPATATIITIAYFLADAVISRFEIEAMAEFRPYFIVPKMDEWVYLLQQTIPWPAILQTWAQLVGIGLTAFVIGWVVFERRDVKS